MPIIRIPSPLRSYTSGQSEVTVHGRTVGDAMSDLVGQFPALRSHLYNGTGELRPFVNLFLKEENVKEMQGMETLIQEDDRLLLIPSVAGG